MPTITAGENLTVFLNPNEVLTVTSAANSTATVFRLGNTPGEASQGGTSITAGTTTVFGPFNTGTRWDVQALTGSITLSTSGVTLTAGTPAKSTYGVDLYGTPAMTYSGTISTPTTGDVRFSNQLLFVALTTAITANSTVTTAPAGSIGITSHATGVGKLFMSDGSKWQFAVVA